jgi:Copper binding proteins, plastocyanin/azurin family
VTITTSTPWSLFDESRDGSQAAAARRHQGLDQQLLLPPGHDHGSHRHKGNVHQRRPDVAHRDEHQTLVGHRGGDPGHSTTVVITKPGTYTYYCQFHAFMRGTIIVK